MTSTLEHDVISAVTEEVWSEFLGVSLAPTATTQGEAECASSISIEGAWNGAVIVACSRQLARQAAATMYCCPVSEIDDANWRDTLNEVANIMGGNLKAKLPSPSSLGLPEAFDTWQPENDPNTVTYMSPVGPLYVTVFPA
ncbi:MAG: hypothetical protein K0S46_2118 [Moraxellaceae bacterium]|jgi:chemotaxis protein CheX|nr:hypothetical protein [Moraxellaceae bacterium]